METVDRQLPILGLNNYQRWKFDLLSALRARDLLDHALGKISIPELIANDANSAERVKQWNTKDAKATSLIAATLDEEHHVLIRSCSTSADVWKTIINYREQSSETNVIELNQKFIDFKFKTSHSVSSYIAELSGILKSLADINSSPSEHFVIAKIIKDLPDKFKHFRTSWNIIKASGTPLSLDILKSQLLAAERELTCENHSNPEEVKNEALVADGTRNFKQGMSKARCYRCGKRGHYSRECRKNRGFNQQRFNQRNNNEVNLVVSSSIKQSDSTWTLDSGASAHMTKHKEWFTDLILFNKPLSVSVGDDHELKVKGKGTVPVQLYDGERWSNGKLRDVLYVPELGSHNIFSSAIITKNGFTVLQKGDDAFIYNSNGQKILVGSRYRDSDLYSLHLKVIEPKSPELSCNLVRKTSIRDWHEKLGHVGIQTINEMVKCGTLGKVDNNGELIADFFCEPCVLGKMSRPSFKSSQRRDCKAGEFIHADIAGPMSERSLSGSRYALVLKDEMSSYCHVKFLKEKSEVHSILNDFLIQAKEETGNAVRRLRTDNGTEFVNTMVRELTRKFKILHETSAPGTPQQNGFVERQNRSIAELARTMLISSGLPKYLWAEAMNTACYCLNRTFKKGLGNITPYKLWYGKAPSYNHMVKFGAQGYILIAPSKRHKWDPKSKSMVFVGYTNTDKNYRMYDPQAKTVTISRDVVFNQSSETVSSRYKLIEEESSDTEDVREVQAVQDEQNGQDLEEVEQQAEEVSMPRSRGRPKGPKEKFVPTKTYELRPRANLNLVHNVTEPLTYKEAIASKDSIKWMQAMDEEIDALMVNQTWQLTDKPRDRELIRCKWVYKIKCDSKGRPSRYKARLVAKGFSQREGIDYNETFAPVVRFESVRVVLAFAAHKRLELTQFDIKTAFLHGELNETIFMEQPEGYDDGSEKVCLLRKSLYGLKQAPKMWNEKFDEHLKSIGFVSSLVDPCVYILNEATTEVILVLYVDDGLIASNNADKTKEILDSLKQNFEIKVGSAETFVGLEIQQSENCSELTIKQEAYATKVLQRFNMLDCKPVNSPADPHIKLTSEQCPETNEERELMNNVPYLEAVGSLMFLAVVSRPDLSYAVSKVSQFSSNPGQIHWQAVKRILRYLKGTTKAAIRYSRTRELIELKAYSDADFATDQESRRSVSGTMVTLCGGAVCWSSRAQRGISQSTTESEYVAAAEAVKDAKWSYQLLCNLGAHIPLPIKLYCDNQAAIALVKNTCYSKRSKHIDVKYHFIREEQANGIIQLEYISTDEQPADFLTKALVGPLMAKCKSLSGMANADYS